MIINHYKAFFGNELLIKPLRPQGKNGSKNVEVISTFLSKNHSTFQRGITKLIEFDRGFYHKVKDGWLDLLHKQHANFPITLRKIDFIEAFEV